MAKPGRGSDQFPLRLPPGMREQIKRVAEENGRSMNSEILDVLREYFPEEPSLEELMEAFDYATSMLREVQANSTSGDVTASNKFLTILGRMEETNEHLGQFVQDRVSPVVRLDQYVVEGLKDLQKEWDVPPALTDSVVSSLIQMSLERISNGQENLKVWIGEGEARRMVELEKPSRGEASEK